MEVATSGLIGLAGPASQNVSLEKGARTMLQIPVTAKTGFGDGEVALEISGLNLPGEQSAASKQQ